MSILLTVLPCKRFTLALAPLPPVPSLSNLIIALEVYPVPGEDITRLSTPPVSIRSGNATLGIFL